MPPVLGREEINWRQGIMGREWGTDGGNVFHVCWDGRGEEVGEWAEVYVGGVGGGEKKQDSSEYGGWREEGGGQEGAGNSGRQYVLRNMVLRLS